MGKVSLSTKIIIGTCLGIFCGLFWGEKVGWMEFVGSGYIKLLQMTILPYIIASLIVGIGSLTYSQAREVALKVGLLTLVIWLIGFGLFFAMPLVFPVMDSGAFFSSVLVEPPPAINYLEMYIPANPFNSMASNYIPAVVLFCLAIGVALIGVKKDDKEILLAPLRVVSQALAKVTNGIVTIMPYGVFFITAASAGTLSVDEFEKLQVYIWIHIVAVGLLAFLILPLFLSSFTRFKYRDVIGISKDALITAFVTGNLFVILPVLTENCKALFEKYDMVRENTGEYVDIVIPVSFNFPNLGKISTFLFVLFAVWFSGGELHPGDYPFLLFGGILTMFGSVNVAIPFLMDGVRIPSDVFQLFVVSGVISGKFSTLLAGMNLLVITLGSTALLTKVGKMNWGRLGVSAALCLGVVVATLVGTRLVLSQVISANYVMDEVVLGMSLGDTAVKHRVQRVAGDAEQEKVPSADIKTIIARGELRVGIKVDELPFSYFNIDDTLVGLDVELVDTLAKDLGIKVHYIPYAPTDLFAALNSGQVDMIVSGQQVTSAKLAQVLFTDPVLNLTLGLVVEDYRFDEFDTLEKVRQHAPFTVAFTNEFQGMGKVIKQYPNVTFTLVNHSRDFFEQDGKRYDMLLTSLEAGMAWSLLYPEFKAFKYDNVRSFPVAYGVAQDNQELLTYLNSWLGLEQSVGTVDRLYRYWIEGENAVPKTPRWSIAKDVLGWVE